ncbi:MAG: hypothetical protein A6F71_05125 [Cycloclasticus sp. symbiont of Poecilosclerida sp. M]|nr:MAG: hypothetical protein A6F71_05125 [Cycloclasticus sp. symbiont of Poecilosclerida sp. M]
MTCKTFLIACLTCAFLGSAQATTLLIDVIGAEPANSTAGLARPVNGMTMKQVTQQCGEPPVKYDAVGTPAITRWEYEQHSVYFENKLVIHSVVNKPQLQTKPRALQ